MTRSFGRATHQTKRFTHLAVGKDVEKGRLSKLDGQCLFQGIIEDRFAGLVVEIGEDDGVLLGQRRCWTGTEVEDTSDQCDDQNDYSGNQNLPEFFPFGDRNFSDFDGGR